MGPSSYRRTAIFLLDRTKYCFYECLNYCISDRYSVHLLHRKKKCSTVSCASPQLHWTDGAALTRNGYEFTLAMPILNWASTLASFHFSWSYIFRVCFPVSAVSRYFLREVPNLLRQTSSITFGACYTQHYRPRSRRLCLWCAALLCSILGFLFGACPELVLLG